MAKVVLVDVLREARLIQKRVKRLVRYLEWRERQSAARRKKLAEAAVAEPFIDDKDI